MFSRKKHEIERSRKFIAPTRKNKLLARVMLIGRFRPDKLFLFAWVGGKLESALIECLKLKN
jgi:hypothetical protein